MPTTYSSLVADKATSFSIKQWVNNNKVDPVVVLEEAQALLFQMLRVREMKALAVINMAEGEYSKALPTGFLDPMSLKNATIDYRIDVNTPDEINQIRHWENDGTTILRGMPRRYAIFDEQLQFQEAFDEACVLQFLYYKKPTVLGVGQETNFLTDRFPHLLRTACRAAAYDFIEDDRYDREMQKLTALVSTTNAESDLVLRGLV